MEVPESVQLARLTVREGVSDGLAKSIIAALPSTESRRAWADVLIDGTCSIDTLMDKVRQLDVEFRKT